MEFEIVLYIGSWTPLNGLFPSRILVGVSLVIVLVTVKGVVSCVSKYVSVLSALRTNQYCRGRAASV